MGHIIPYRRALEIEGQGVKEEDKLRAELAETKAKLHDAESRLNQLAGEMRARLDQLTTGRRSEFEETLIRGLQDIYRLDTSFCEFLRQANPALTSIHADKILKVMSANSKLYAISSERNKLYSDMRLALEVMLTRLPPAKDPDGNDISI